MVCERSREDGSDNAAAAMQTMPMLAMVRSMVMGGSGAGYK